MFKILDVEKLMKAPLHTEYFPYCVVDCFIKKTALQKVLNHFPPIEVKGSIPAFKLRYADFFQKFIDELQSDELRAIIAQKFSIDLSLSPTMLTIRGQTDGSDGKIHTDTPTKLMTLLLYLNEDWQEKSGNLRLLRNNVDLENYFEEVIPSAGKLLVFKVTDNCWHGHHSFVGKRRALQLNYVTDHKIVNQEMKKHAFSYSLKQLIYKIRHLGNEKNIIG